MLLAFAHTIPLGRIPLGQAQNPHQPPWTGTPRQSPWTGTIPMDRHNPTESHWTGTIPLGQAQSDRRSCSGQSCRGQAQPIPHGQAHLDTTYKRRHRAKIFNIRELRNSSGQD